MSLTFKLGLHLNIPPKTIPKCILNTIFSPPTPHPYMCTCLKFTLLSTATYPRTVFLTHPSSNRGEEEDPAMTKQTAYWHQFQNNVILSILVSLLWLLLLFLSHPILSGPLPSLSHKPPSNEINSNPCWLEGHPPSTTACFLSSTGSRDNTMVSNTLFSLKPSS